MTLAARPPELRGRVFRGSAARRRGLVTLSQLRGSTWRRLMHDVYADAALPDGHLLRCEAAGLLLPPGAALTGRSAACLRGLPLGAPEDPVAVVVPRSVRFGPYQGMRIRRADLDPDDVIPGRPPVTTPVRSALEVAREPDLVEAVVALDVMLGTGYVHLDELVARAAHRPRSRIRRAVRLADGRADSPPESRLRVRLALAGLPRPTPQHVVGRPGGGFVARVDLAWPERRVALEYDGAWHGSPSQLRRDRARLNLLIGLGWQVLHATADTLRDPERFAVLVAQLRRALR